MNLSDKQKTLNKYIKKLKDKNPDLNIGNATDFSYKNIGSAYITGIIPYDILVGGGNRKGTFNEISGEEDVGKSTFFYELMQRLSLIYEDKTIVYVDAEGKLDELTMERFPLINWGNKVVVLDSSTMEDMFETIEAIRQEVEIDFVFIDSVSALESRQSQEKALDKAEMGINARQFARGWKSAYNWPKQGITTFFINQLRDTMDQYNPKKETGGNAIRYIKDTSVRLIKSTSRDKSLGLEEIEVANAMGGEKNKTKKVSLPFANEVTFRNMKIKSTGIHKDERIMYLKNRSFTSHKAYELYSNTPGGFLESYSNFALAFKTPMIESKGAFISFYHPFTGELIEKYNGKAKFAMAMEINPKLYFLLCIGLYFYGLNRNRETNNKIFYNRFYTLVKASMVSTKIKYSYYKEKDFFDQKIYEEIDSYLEEFLKEYPLDFILTEEEYNEYKKRYGEKPWSLILNEVKSQENDEQLEEGK